MEQETNFVPKGGQPITKRVVEKIASHHASKDKQKFTKGNEKKKGTGRV